MKQITDKAKQGVDWVRNGSEVKTPEKSRTLIGVGMSALTRVGAFAAFLAANPEIVEQIAEAIGGPTLVVWAGFVVGFLGDLLAAWARFDDHLKGRNK